MLDCENRQIDYLRISVTDRCNLRCAYCMPDEGIAPSSHNDILRYEEILRLCRCAASLGISKIKITGGEPLVRKGIDQLIGQIKSLPGIQQVTITTNAVLLPQYLDSLAQKGLDGVNISLDAVTPEDYLRIARRNDYDTVMKALWQAVGKGLRVKINCVPIAGLNDGIAVPMAKLAKNTPIDIRFIELMPLGIGSAMQAIPRQTLQAELESAYGPLVPCHTKRGNGPAEYFSLAGFEGKIGFISAVSHMFCGSCNRVRLTAQGFLKLCLQYDTGVDLRELLRGKATDTEVATAMEQAIFCKPRQHHFSDADLNQGKDQRGMSQIGG